MPKLPKFVIYTDRLVSDIDKVSRLLEKFESDISLAGFYTPGFSFALQAASLRSVPAYLRAVIEQQVKRVGDEDVFGNKYKNFFAYDRLEIAVNSSMTNFSAIRFLGDRDKNLKDQSRSAHTDIVNTELTRTTINILSDIRELSDGITEFFGSSGLSDALRCGQDSNNLENIVNSITGLVGISPTSNGGPSVDSAITWSEFLNTYVIPKVATQPINTGFSGEELSLVIGKYDSKPFKTLAEKKKEEAEWASAAFKGRIVSSRDQAFEVVNSSADILGNPEGLIAKIETLGDAYTHLLDKVSLGCLIKSAMECIIPPLSCKEILRGLRMENIEDKIALAFPNQPRLVAKVEAAVIKAREENTDEFAASDAFLDAIENFIDLEAVCDIINFAAAGGFQIPTIELPELDIIDLFGSVEIAIEDAILSALVTAIMQMVLGVINDLASCDNLDSFIAGALDGQIPTDSGVLGDLVRLFTNPEDLLDSEKGSIASSLDSRWDQFVQVANPLLEQAVKVEIEGGADILGGAIQLRADIDGAGGLEGLHEALKGNLGDLAARAVFESFFQGQIDLTQLLEFRGTQSAATLNSLLAEIGRFEMSSDGESFTLQRVSDDQTVAIFSSLGRTTPNVAIGSNSQELANSVGPVLDDAAAILSPGDTLNLLAGTPSRRTVEVIIELIKQSHTQISFINKPDQVISLFKTLGDTTGTSNIKDAVILASNTRRTRHIPRKFCPEDDEALALQEQILTTRLPPEEVRTIIDEIIEKRRLRYNELGDILVRLSNDDFSPTELLEPIICGLNPDGSRPQVVSDALEATMNTMFESVKMTFDREIPRYTDALSSEEKIDRPVPRKISRNSAAPVFGTGTNLFSRADDNENADFDGGDIDNPEFIQLVPPPLNALANESAEDAYERYLRDVLIDDEGNGDIDSINVEDVIKRVGENFKKSFRFDKTAKVKQSSARAFEVQVAGSLPPQSPSQDYSPFPVAAPSWLITYKEKDHVMTLDVSAKGAIFSQRLGRLPFTEDFFFSEKYEIDSDVQDRISHLNEAVFGHNSKPEIFSSLLQEKLSPALMWQPEDRFDATGIAVNTPFDSGDYFKPKYDEFVNRFLNTAGIRVSNNRLLKKIPNKSLSNLAPLGDAGPTFGAKPNTETLLVNLINFSAAPTEAQRRCKADPHILDLEFVKSIVKEEFEKDCEHESNNDGISRSRSPINSSGYVGVVLTIVRLYAVESVLKGLFVFDEYGYKEDFANDQLFISYISRKMIKDIERQGDFADGANYFKEFEREAKIAHEKMVSSKQIEPDGLGALESLIKFQLKSVLNKVRDLVGTNPSEAEGSIIRSLLTALPVIPVYSNFDFGFGGGGTYESANSRLDFIEPKGDFVIEKYIRIPKVISHSPPSDAEIAQNHTGLHGVVNLKNWDEFILTNQGLADEQISSLFPAPWKYGYRLVYVTSIEGESRRETELPTREYIFGNRSIPLRGDLVDKEKAFHVYEKSIIEEHVAEGDTIFHEVKTYTQYNTIPIAEVEIKIDNFMDKMKDSKEKIEQNFDLIYEEQLLALLEQELDTRTLFDYCFFANRLFALLFINSSLALNTEDMRMLFEGTKGELKRLFAILRNMGDYTSKSDAQFLDGVPGNASAFKADFDSIGSPSGPRGPDAFYLASITPILILRGLAELTDPNIAITSKIVAAGNAGYLLPKFARDLRGDIRPNDLGLPIIQKTPVGVLDPNGYECILRESDDLPSFVDDFTEMDWDSNEVPNFPGAEIVEGKLRIDRGPNRELYGLDRSVFSENPQAIVQSIPEFPGESVNLPYGLVSLALLPLQVFFPILGPFTGPPNTPLGKLFLQLEPLIYQLPSYKYALVETDVAKEILLSEGIDLSGAKKFKCDDGAESEPEPKTLPSSNPAPEGVDSC